MNLKELSAAVAAEVPDVAAGKIRAVLSAAFAKLHAELEAVTEGKVITPLGAVRVAVKKKAGDEGAEAKRRLILNLAKAKEDQAEDPEKAAAKAAEKATRQAARQATRKAERQAARQAKSAE